ASRHEAWNWLINHQLGRRNLTGEQRTYLLGKIYNEQKQQHGGEREASGNSCHLPNTAEKIGADHHVSARTVRNAGEFAAAVGALWEDIPVLKGIEMAGESSAPMKDIIAAGQLPPKQRQEAAEQITAGKKPEIDKPRPNGLQLNDPRPWQRWDDLFGKLKRD